MKYKEFKSRGEQPESGICDAYDSTKKRIIYLKRHWPLEKPFFRYMMWEVLMSAAVDQIQEQNPDLIVWAVGHLKTIF